MAPNTILLNVRAQFEKEAPLKASKDITPGMLIEYSGADVQPHSSAAAIPAPLIVAVEAPWRYGSGIDDAYDTDGEQVAFHYILPGDEFYALLAAGEDIALGDLLESAGDGTLQADTSGDKFRALEAVDNGAGYTAVRIRVEVI